MRQLFTKLIYIISIHIFVWSLIKCKIILYKWFSTKIYFFNYLHTVYFNMFMNEQFIPIMSQQVPNIN